MIEECFCVYSRPTQLYIDAVRSYARVLLLYITVLPLFWSFPREARRTAGGNLINGIGRNLVVCRNYTVKGASIHSHPTGYSATGYRCLRFLV